MAVPNHRPLRKGSIESNPTISMSADHFRWLLMWHGSIVRRLTLIEAARFGFAKAHRNSKKLDRQREQFLRRLQLKES
jgi:hypothetical protein